jgi:hypothetical protein
MPCVLPLALLLAQAAPSPSPEPGPSAAGPPRLRLDIERHVDSVMRGHGDTPSFQTEIEVIGRPPDVALEELLRDFDLECGPSTGPPTAVESREFRPHPAPYLDLTVLAQMLSSALSKPGPPRYFLYRLRGTGGPEYLLREEALVTAPGQQPTTSFELVASFPDLDSALRAYRRMARGFETPERADKADPPPPWATTTCRLRPRR